VIAAPLAELELEIVPQLHEGGCTQAPPEMTARQRSNIQVTPALLEPPLTVAMSCRVPPGGTVTVVGVTVTAMEGTRITNEPCADASVIEVAVSVTFRLLLGRVGGGM
jgi:hypothetical protein